MDIQATLLKLAQQMEATMLAIGLDPRDMNAVESFIEGCKLDRRLMVLICEELDDE